MRDGRLRVAGALRFAPRRLLVSLFVVSLAYAVVPSATAVMTGQVIRVVQSRGPLGGWLVGLCLLLAARESLMHTLNLVNTTVGRRIDGAVRSQVRRHLSAATDLEKAEDPAVVADAALAATSGGPSGYIRSIGSGAFALVQDLFQIFGLVLACLVVARTSWLAGLTLLLLVIAIRAWQRRQHLAMAGNSAREATGQRRTRYWADLAGGEAGAKELRVFGFGSWVIERWREQALGYLEPSWRDWHRALTLGLGPVGLLLAAAAVVFGTPAWLGWQGQIGVEQIVEMIVAGTATLTSRRTGLQSVERAEVCLRALDRLGAAVTPLRAETGSPSILDDADATTETPNPILPSAAGWIQLRNVKFRYPGGPAVLDGIDLDIAPGEVVAFVGVNGAGKTTLAKILCKAYHPQAGSRSWPVDGKGVDQRVGVIFQDFIRFPLTLAENVRLGAPDYDDAEGVLNAIRLAGASDIVERLPSGLETVLSKAQHGGVDLSGGQWQKIALARAIFAVQHGRSILIMDEPTAHLDADLEAEFHDRVVKTLAGTTIIMISHRLSTVRSADRIVLIDRGRIAEQGNHTTLMAADGQYARLFRLQASRFAEVGTAGPLKANYGEVVGDYD